ncbi:MAG TPA: alpha/beta fold hydrolase [Anaerolineales bacterium]|nr:alpha/beta fold hydrolase [Anaerolineales bacterium]
MSTSNKLDPSPFLLVGGQVGVLLIHGFTASPTQLRLIGNDLHQRGLTVSAPLLPGHGTTVADLRKQRWQSWVGHVELALADLKSRCNTVFVAGISLGSLLTLYLAAEHADLKGIILYSPLVKMPGGIAIHLVPVLKYLIRELRKAPDFSTDPHALDRLWDYRSVPLFAVDEIIRLRARVQPLLPRITRPTLIIYSTLDRLIARNSAQFTYDHIGTANKTLITLHNSGHDVTLDSEWKEVTEQTWQFIRKRTNIENIKKTGDAI